MEIAHKHKKALVTGAGGFIGSHLVERLVREGVEVTAFLHYNARMDIGLLRDADPVLIKNVRMYFGDLKDYHAVLQAMKGQDVVYHLGALIGIPYSYLHPCDVIETNVLGTLNVLMAAREVSVGRVVHTSTSEVYGTAQAERISERHVLQGQSPYSASKIGADKIVESFVNAYRVPAVTIRPFNTFGPRQSLRAIIPALIAQALFQDAIQVGSLDPVRDFTFVHDTVDGFVLGATIDGIEGDVLNLGTDREVSIRDVLQMVVAMIGCEDKPIHTADERMRPTNSEVMRLRSDNTRALRVLGWTPQTTFEEGLRQTISWIREHQHEYDTHQYVV